jgi:hypothetical protein
MVGNYRPILLATRKLSADSPTGPLPKRLKRRRSRREAVAAHDLHHLCSIWRQLRLDPATNFGVDTL